MGLRSLIRNVHWLNALAAATIIVSCAPRSSSDAKSTAYDTDIVDERRASGRFTLKTEVIDDKRSSRRKSSTRPVKCVGKNATSRAAPTPMTAPTKSLAVSGRVSIKLPRQPSDESSPRYLRSGERSESAAPPGCRAPVAVVEVCEGVGLPDDDVCVRIERGAPNGGFRAGRGTPDGVIGVEARAPHDVRTVGAATIRAPHYVFNISRAAPHEARALTAGAPDDAGGVERCRDFQGLLHRGAPDVHVASGGRALGAPRDVSSIGRARTAPDHARGPRVGGRQQLAVRKTLVPPDDRAAPRGGIALTRPREASARRKRPRQFDGAARIEEPRSLRKRLHESLGFRCVLEDRLDEIGREVRICLEHQRDRAADDRRGHARAAQCQVRLAPCRDGAPPPAPPARP